MKWIKIFRSLKDDFQIGRGGFRPYSPISERLYCRENKRVLFLYNERIYKVQGTKIEPGIKVKEREYLFKEFQRKFSYFTILPECKKVATNNKMNYFLYLHQKD